MRPTDPEWQEIWDRLAELTTSELSTAFGRAMSFRTPAKGVVHRWKPESPFPFGSVIKPTAANVNFDSDVRQMIVGPASAKEATATIDLGAKVESPIFRWWVHLNETMTERWEIADD